MKIELNLREIELIEECLSAEEWHLAQQINAVKDDSPWQDLHNHRVEIHSIRAKLREILNAG